MYGSRAARYFFGGGGMEGRCTLGGGEDGREGLDVGGGDEVRMGRVFGIDGAEGPPPFAVETEEEAPETVLLTDEDEPTPLPKLELAAAADETPFAVLEAPPLALGGAGGG